MDRVYDVKVVTNDGKEHFTRWEDARLTRGDYFGCLSGFRHKGSVQCLSCISEIKEL